MRILLDAGDIPTPGLSEAILGHHTDIVRLLLLSGARKEVDARKGQALKAVRPRGDRELMRLSLNAGANPLVCGGKCMKQACLEGRLCS